MSWLNTFSFVMRANVTTLKERFSDPERMLHQLIIDMEQELGRVRESVAGAIADQIQLERRVQKTQDEVDHWSERATSAIGRGDESSAKLALEQKLMSQQRGDTLATELVKQREQTDKLRSAVQELEDKIRQARQKQTLLLARLTRAESSTRINQALNRVQSKSAFAEFSRLEQRVEREEAMSEAYDRLEGRDPVAEDLERQFEESDRKERLEREFEELKSRVQESAQ
ncbi:MAG: PspA/IM30 family protein [Planctomycetaceae bacterium]|nr:PspA/IM30 family protein [Planctomycetales bacterium]MCB9927735.1 PspA/IM30 family protein [Planctomycetaceae bacterium]